MKKIFLLLISFILLFLPGESRAFWNQRYAWWEQVYRKSCEERDRLLKNKHLNEGVTELIDSDIKRAEKFLKIFDREKENGDAYENRKYTSDEIKEIVKEYTEPLFAIRYLGCLVDNAGSIESLHRTDELIESGIEKITENYLNTVDPNFTRLVKARNIDTVESKLIAMEVHFNGMQRMREAILNDMAADIEKAVIDKLTINDFFSSREAIKDTLLSAGMKYDLAGRTGYTHEDLEKSWCWGENKSDVETGFDSLNAILAVTGKSPDEILLDRISAHYKEPASLEKEVFPAIKDQLIDNGDRWSELKNKKFDDDLYVMIIPEKPDFPALFSGIDEIRKRMVSPVSADSANTLPENPATLIDETIGEYLDDAENTFRKEEERLSAERARIYETELNKTLFERIFNLESIFPFLYDRLTVANEEEFNKARKIYDNNRDLVRGYRDATLAYLKFLNADPQAALPDTDEYTRRLEINRNYIDFIAALIKNGAAAPFKLPRELHNSISSSVQRIPDIFKIIELSFGIRNLPANVYTGEQLDMIDNVKQSIRNDIEKSRLKIEKARRAITAAQNKDDKFAPFNGDNEKKRVAEFEMELFYNKISDYYSAYKSLDYAGRIFNEYHKIFNELEDRVKIYSLPGELEYVFKKDSIFPLIKNFDMERLNREYKTKRYLHIALNREIARQKTMALFYKRKGILIDNYPDDDEIKQIKDTLNNKPETRIAGWIMNETNFRDIDKNAVSRLRFTRKRIVWNKRPDPETDSGTSVKLNKLHISLTIPEGWHEQEIRHSDIENGILKIYKSLDGKSSIYIAAVDSSGLDKREISKFWIDKMERKMVKQRWGSKDNREYLWTLSSNRAKRDVMELYAVSCDNHVLLISGVSTKDKYNFFRNKITGVFNSISAGF